MICYNKVMRFFILILPLILSSCSCQEELPNYSRKEMLEWARQADPNMKIKVGDLTKALVDCKDYTPRCQIGYRVVMKTVEFNVLQYNDQKSALEAAKRVRGYVARNWVFDEVRGEPVLERIVTKHLRGKPAF